MTPKLKPSLALLNNLDRYSLELEVMADYPKDDVQFNTNFKKITSYRIKGSR